MMKKLAVFLAIVLVVTMLPVTAFAAATEIAMTKDGDTICSKDLGFLYDGYTYYVTSDITSIKKVGSETLEPGLFVLENTVDENPTPPIMMKHWHGFDMVYKGEQSVYSSPVYEVVVTVTSTNIDDDTDVTTSDVIYHVTLPLESDVLVDTFNEAHTPAITLENPGEHTALDISEDGNTITTFSDEGPFELRVNLLDSDLYTLGGDTSAEVTVAMLTAYGIAATVDNALYTDTDVDVVLDEGEAYAYVKSPAVLDNATANAYDFTLTLSMKNYKEEDISVTYDFDVMAIPYVELSEVNVKAGAELSFGEAALAAIPNHDAAALQQGASVEIAIDYDDLTTNSTRTTIDEVVAYLNDSDNGATGWLKHNITDPSDAEPVSDVTYSANDDGDKVLITFTMSESGKWRNLELSLDDGSNVSEPLAFPKLTIVYPAGHSSIYINLNESTVKPASHADVLSVGDELIYEIKAANFVWSHGSGSGINLKEILDKVTVSGLDSIKNAAGRPIFTQEIVEDGGKTYLILTADELGAVSAGATVTLTDPNTGGDNGVYPDPDASSHQITLSVPTVMVAELGLKTSEVSVATSPGAAISIGDVLKFEITTANFNISDSISYTSMLYLMRNKVDVTGLDTSLFSASFGNEGSRVYLYLTAVGEGSVTRSNDKFTLTDKTPAPIPQVITVTIPRLDITKLTLNTSTISPQSSSATMYVGDTLQYEITTNHTSWSGYGAAPNILNLLKNNTVIKGLNETIFTPDFYTDSSSGKTYLRLTAKGSGVIANSTSFTIEEKSPSYIPQVLTMVLPAMEVTKVPVSITGNQIDGIDSSSALSDNVYVGDTSVSDVEDISVFPGESIYLYFDSDLFTWTNGTPVPAQAVTSAMLRTGKITVGSNATSESSPVEYVNFLTKGGQSMVEVKIKNDIKSTKDKKFSVTVFLNENGRRHNGSQAKLSGVITQNEYEVYSDDESVDMTLYPVIKAVSSVKNVELYLGNGITLTANLSNNRSYYASTNTDLTTRDEAVMNRYPTVEEVYHLETSGFTNGKVTIDSSSQMYVYDRDGLYLGTTNDKLALSDVYYLSNRRITMNIAPVNVEEDDGSLSPTGTGSGVILDASRPFVATFTGNLADLQSVQLATAGGTFIDITNVVEKTAGSVIITVPQSYLSTLANGTYTLRAVFPESSRDVQFTLRQTQTSGTGGGTGTGNYNPSTGAA